MTQLGTPLAVFDDTGLCDNPREHHLRIVTNGTTAYAYGTARGATDCPYVSKDQQHVTVTCGQNLGPGDDGDPCPGQAVFDLATPDCWSTDPDTIHLWERFAEKVDQ